METCVFVFATFSRFAWVLPRSVVPPTSDSITHKWLFCFHTFFWQTFFCFWFLLCYIHIIQRYDFFLLFLFCFRDIKSFFFLVFFLFFFNFHFYFFNIFSFFLYKVCNTHIFCFVFPFYYFTHTFF